MKPKPLNKKTFTTLQIKSLKPGGLADHHRFLSEQWVRVSDLESACEFYLKYFYNPWKLWNEQPIYRCKKLNEFIKNINENSEGFSDIPETTMMKYNKWLFKLAFKAVLGEDKE